MALQIDLCNAGDARQRRFDIAINNRVEIARTARVVCVDRPHQQRGRIAAGEIAAGQIHPRAVGLAGQGGDLLQTVDDIEIGPLHVVIHLEREIDVAPALIDVRLDLGQPGQIAQYALLLLDDDRLHIGRRCTTPECRDRDLRLIDGRKQLDGQLEQRSRAHTHQ